MKTVKYEFTTQGIKAMYNDSLEEIFSALAEENENFAIDDLDIKITLGNKTIEIPISADAFEILFSCINEIKETEDF